MLTETQRKLREGKLTASRVACLMTGDKPKILALWREMLGDPTYTEENLDDVWAIQLGSWTEKLNLDWYERTKQRALTWRGHVLVHPEYSWASSTLDGFDPVLPGPVETKHVGGYEKFDVVLQRYMPQVHWQMECTQTRQCALSVIQGARAPTITIIDYDKDYADEMMARALRFMEHVWNMTEPVVLDEVKIKSITRTKNYNYTSNNYWASYANEWLTNKAGAKKFEEAEKKLREMVPNDAAKVEGHGIKILRDRANRLSIKDINEKKSERAIAGKDYSGTK